MEAGRAVQAAHIRHRQGTQLQLGGAVRQERQDGQLGGVELVEPVDGQQAQVRSGVVGQGLGRQRHRLAYVFLVACPAGALQLEVVTVAEAAFPGLELRSANGAAIGVVGKRASHFAQMVSPHGVVGRVDQPVVVAGVRHAVWAVVVEAAPVRRGGVGSLHQLGHEVTDPTGPAEPGHERHAEQVAPEADGGVHVGGGHGQVVDAGVADHESS